MESFFFKTALNKIREGIEEFGIFPYVTYLLNRAFKKTGGKLSIEHFCLFAIPVPDKTSHNIPKFLKNSYKVRVLHKYDQELEHFDTSFSTLQYRFNQNAACLLAKKKDEPVGFMWLVQNRYPEDIVYLDVVMPQRVAWDFDVFVFEQYRFTPAFCPCLAGRLKPRWNKDDGHFVGLSTFEYLRISILSICRREQK